MISLSKVPTVMKQYRLNKGYSVQQAASRSGIGATTIFRVEEGGNLPNMYTLACLLACYGKTLAQLEEDASMTKLEVDIPCL